MRYLCKQPHYSISGCRLVGAENTSPCSTKHSGIHIWIIVSKRTNRQYTISISTNFCEVVKKKTNDERTTWIAQRNKKPIVFLNRKNKTRKISNFKFQISNFKFQIEKTKKIIWRTNIQKYCGKNYSFFFYQNARSL